MFSAVSEAERDAITAIAFVGTFFVTLGVGRFLKRRAGVRLGLLFRLFCLMLAFYVAIAVYGVHASWRNHIGAAVVLLSTALVVLLFVLSYGYHAEAQLKGVLAGSGVVAIILGFAGQNFFAGIIGGIAIQLNRPYKVGDWLQVGERFAQVMEINWRSTRLRTNDAIYLDIPNNEMVSHAIVNLHYPTEVHAMRIRVGVEYKNPPNSVKDALFRAASSADGVLAEPKPKIFLVDFADFAVIYEIKFYMGNHARIKEINDAVRTNVWYELKRQRITIPFPIRTLHVERRAARTVQEDQEEARIILRDEPPFERLSDAQIENLVKEASLNHFGRGERVIQEGAEGDSMFILLRGTANVSVNQNGSPIQVAALGSGDYFGEMSLLTGERRSATVRADGDCYVMEISKDVMAGIIRDSPDCLRQLSEILATRKMETEGVKDAARPADQAAKETEYRATFLRRLKTFFEL